MSVAMIILIILLKAPNNLHQEATIDPWQKGISPLPCHLPIPQTRHLQRMSPKPSPQSYRLTPTISYPHSTMHTPSHTNTHPTEGLPGQDSDLLKVTQPDKNRDGA